MAKSIQFGSGAFSHSNSTDRYLPIGNSSNTLSSATEDTVAYWAEIDLLNIGNIQCYVKANTRTAGTAIITLRDYSYDIAPNMMCQIPFGTTGSFVSSGAIGTLIGDAINYVIRYGTGGTGQIDFNSISCTIDTRTSDTVTRFTSYINATIGTGTQYAQIVHKSLSLQTTESNTQTKVPLNGTMKNLFVYVTSNTRNGDTTLTLRKNGADGNLTLTITASTTGVFEDISNTDTISDGDLLNWKTVRGGTTGSLAVSIIGSDLTTTDNSFASILAGSSTFSPGSATDYFMQIGGNTIEADTDAQTKHKFYLDNFYADKLRIHLTTNTVASTSTLTFRKNGADTALTVSITASTTGLFEDTTHSVAITGADDVNYKLAAGGSGSLVVKYASIRFYETTPASPSWLSGFTNRSPRRIRFDYVYESVPYLPIFLSGCDATWWANVLSNGNDIRITKSDGTTLLDHYLVASTFNTTTKVGCILVKVSGYINCNLDRTIYIYCGNSGASSVSNSANVFSGSTIVGFYLPGETLTELTGSGKDLTAFGSPTTATSGYEGIKAAVYDGSTQYHSYTGTQALTTWPLTIEALAYSTDLASNQSIASFTNSSSNTDYAEVYFAGAAGDGIAADFKGTAGSTGSSETSTDYTTSTWRYAAASRSGNTGTGVVYIDGGGSNSNSTTISSNAAFDRFTIGALGLNAGYLVKLTGRVAMTAVYNVPISSARVFTNYASWIASEFTVNGTTEVNVTSNINKITMFFGFL